MADQDNSRDEFVFEEENTQSPEYTQKSYEGSTENIKSILKNRRLMLMLSGVIGLWIVTYLFDSMSSDNTEDLVEPAASSASISAAKEALTEPDNQISEQVDSQINQVQSRVESNTQGMSKISKSIDDQNAVIQTAYKNYNELNARVNKLTSALDDIHYEIKYMHQLNTTLLNKTDSIEALLKKEAEKKVAKKAPVKKPLKEFTIRAVVEGRAWLVDAKGKATTVSPGESLTDYGKIDKIYPQQGFITTTSGRVIQFPHD